MRRKVELSNVVFGVVWGVMLLATVVALSGCGESEASKAHDEAAQAPMVRGVYGSRIYEIRLQDGTRCAYFIGGHVGGLSCDWTEPRR